MWCSVGVGEGEGWRKGDWHWDDVGCLIGMVMRGGNGDFGVFCCFFAR